MSTCGIPYRQEFSVLLAPQVRFRAPSYHSRDASGGRVLRAPVYHSLQYMDSQQIMTQESTATGKWIGRCQSFLEK